MDCYFLNFNFYTTGFSTTYFFSTVSFFLDLADLFKLLLLLLDFLRGLIFFSRLLFGCFFPISLYKSPPLLDLFSFALPILIIFINHIHTNWINSFFMYQPDIHQADLKQLVNNVNKSINSFKKLFPQPHPNHSSQPTRSSLVPRKIQKFEKHILSLVKYAYLVLQYAKKTSEKNEKNQTQLQRTKKRLKQAISRMISLEQETMNLRKQLNEKEKEVQNLKNLNKINVSYISSVEVENSEKSQNQEQPSENSLEYEPQLQSYNSEEGNSKIYSGEEEMKMNEKAEESILELLNNLDKIVTFADKSS